MALPVKITNGQNEALVTSSGQLRVATEEFVQFAPKFGTFLNDTYSDKLNQSVSFTGTPEQIHNGTDTALWTASVIAGPAGRWNFASAAQAYTGVLSIDATASRNNETALLTAAAPVTIGNYTAFSGAIYLTGYGNPATKGINIQLRIGGVAVGNIINLGDFISTTMFNVWQTFAIGLSAFGVLGTPTIDEMTITTIDTGRGPPPNYFLDALQFEEFGAPIEYRMTPTLGQKFSVTEIRFVMVDNITGGLSYDKLMGVNQLATGIQFQVIQDGVVTYSANFKDLRDMVVYDMHEVDLLDDGVNTLLTMELGYDSPIVLDGTVTRNYMRVIINDDLSGLLDFRVIAQGFEEV